MLLKNIKTCMLIFMDCFERYELISACFDSLLLIFFLVSTNCKIQLWRNVKKIIKFLFSNQAPMWTRASSIFLHEKIYRRKRRLIDHHGANHLRLFETYMCDERLFLFMDSCSWRKSCRLPLSFIWDGWPNPAQSTHLNHHNQSFYKVNNIRVCHFLI